MSIDRWSNAADIAAAVAAKEVRAVDVVRQALGCIEYDDKSFNAFTMVTAERAMARAEAIDASPDLRRMPLAGVPFAVKNLFDVAGVSTLAGSKINRDRPAAKSDAVLVQRLEAAGAVLVGALNMGEYAYDFTGENAHYGASCNPHDVTRMTGGSSGGSAGAVAGGLVPLALCSDTNGSIRVPASFCGLFGLKPTYGRLPRTGTFPFVSSLDHLGPVARSVKDLALGYDAVQGWDAGDPACARREREPSLPSLDIGVKGLRIARAGGYFGRGLTGEAEAAVAKVSSALGANDEVEIADAGLARIAAYLITATESASLHLQQLRTRAADYDPAVRDRLISGTMLPADVLQRAQKFRRVFRDRVLGLFQTWDAIIAPATHCTAPLIGQSTIEIDGATLPLRPNIGIFTQPISFIGLPVAAVPVPLKPLPIGVQIITAPGREDLALRIARSLERDGVCAAPRPRLPEGATS